MKKLFLPLLASFALPTAVYAESVWLIIHKGWGEHGSLVNLEMKDMAQCELQGAVVKAAEDINNYGKRIGVVCIEGS